MSQNIKNNIVMLCVTLGSSIVLIVVVALVIMFQLPQPIATFKGKYGFINDSGKLIIPAQYDEVNNFSCGLARVKKGKVWQFIDRTGETIFQTSLRVTTSRMV